jgi:predicted lipid-binding transport protein (Tim44 family)
MKNWLLGALVVALATSTPMLSEAKRLGSGKSQGMQRSAPAQSAPQSPPAQQAAPQPTAPTPAAAPAAAGATAAAAAAAPAKRSWMGPIAGLAAGLGLAALMSHLGMGEAFANFLMLALLGVAAVFLIAFLMRRFGRGARQEPALASAGASASGSPASWTPAAEPVATRPQAPAAATATAIQKSAFTPAAADVSVTGQPLTPLGGSAEVSTSTSAAAVTTLAQAPAVATGPKLPEGFDLPAFERVAKMIFIRLQAANDKGDLDDLRQFTTPEMFAAIRLDLQERGSDEQTTDVEKVEALVVDYAVEDGKQIVSVRFQGLISEESGVVAVPFDEVWHLVKPEGDSGFWAIAGIQQPQ